MSGDTARAMSQENVEIVRASWDAWERGDMEGLFALYDPEIVWDQSHYETVELSGAVYRGHDGVKRFFREWLAPWDNYYSRADDFIDAEDAVVVRAIQGGRGKESGVEVAARPYWQVYWLRAGLIVRIEPYDSRARALEAVGLSE